jgi:hypothetical protein
MQDASNPAPRRLVRRSGEGWVPAQRRPDEAPVRSAAVRPPSPTWEESRRDRARQHLKEARQARSYENYER